MGQEEAGKTAVLLVSRGTIGRGQVPIFHRARAHTHLPRRTSTWLGSNVGQNVHEPRSFIPGCSDPFPTRRYGRYRISNRLSNSPDWTDSTPQIRSSAAGRQPNSVSSATDSDDLTLAASRRESRDGDVHSAGRYHWGRGKKVRTRSRTSQRLDLN